MDNFLKILEGFSELPYIVTFGIVVFILHYESKKSYQSYLKIIEKLTKAGCLLGFILAVILGYRKAYGFGIADGGRFFSAFMLSSIFMLAFISRIKKNLKNNKKDYANSPIVD